MEVVFINWMLTPTLFTSLKPVLKRALRSATCASTKRTIQKRTSASVCSPEQIMTTQTIVIGWQNNVELCRFSQWTLAVAVAAVAGYFPQAKLISSHLKRCRAWQNMCS